MTMMPKNPMGMPFSKDEYFKMVQNMYQQKPKTPDMSNDAMTQLRMAAQNMKMSMGGKGK